MEKEKGNDYCFRDGGNAEPYLTHLPLRESGSPFCTSFLSFIQSLLPSVLTAFDLLGDFISMVAAQWKGTAQVFSHFFHITSSRTVSVNVFSFNSTIFLFSNSSRGGDSPAFGITGPLFSTRVILHHSNTHSPRFFIIIIDITEWRSFPCSPSHCQSK